MRLCIIMAEFPAMPFWTDAYMLDTGHLTDAEHGRYLLLLILMWRSPECRIPNDPEWICRKLCRTDAEYHAEIMPLIKEFCTTDGNYVYQKKLQEQFSFLRKQSKNQSVRAKSRWDKAKDTSGGSSPASTRHMPKQCRTDASTSTPLLKRGEKVLGKEGKENGNGTIGHGVYVKQGTEAWDAWDKFYRKSKGKPPPHDTKGGWLFPTEFPSEGATQ